MAFARYAAIVKNLRGVVVGYLEEAGCEDSIKWLASRFRYRDLGVGPRFLARYGSIVQRYLGGKPLREIVYPVSELEAFAVELSRRLSLDEMVGEALVLASAYVSPVIAVGNRVASELSRFSVAKVLADVESMNVQDWKLHLRIADYTVLDFYEQCVIEGIELLKRGLRDIETVLKSREERVLKDVKRYWRISKSEGKPFLMYIDMLRVSYEVLRSGKYSENVAAALAIIPVVCVPPSMK